MLLYMKKVGETIEGNLLPAISEFWRLWNKGIIESFSVFFSPIILCVFFYLCTSVSFKICRKKKALFILAVITNTEKRFSLTESKYKVRD